MRDGAMIGCSGPGVNADAAPQGSIEQFAASGDKHLLNILV